MIIWADGQVTEVRGGWPGAVELQVARSDGSAVRALAYTTLMAPPEVGDRVLFDPEDKAEVEVNGESYVLLRERDVHAVAADRLDDSETGLYL